MGSGKVSVPASRTAGFACVMSFACPLVVEAQNADELAKQLANPIASLTSVPLQLNYDEGYGPPGNGDRFFLNVQPVVPVPISSEWNLISRTILPLLAQEDVVPGTGSQSGIGDITQSLFFSPREAAAGGWIWGAGPAFLIPTATDDLLGTEKWGAGPTIVTLKQTHTGWTYGALVNQIWSFAGSGNRADVDSTFLQPFLAKAMSGGRTVTVNVESTYDWEASQWTVPINLTYNRVGQMGSQHYSYLLGARYYAEAPEGGPEWGLRLALTLLYPRR